MYQFWIIVHHFFFFVFCHLLGHEILGTNTRWCKMGYGRNSRWCKIGHKHHFGSMQTSKHYHISNVIQMRLVISVAERPNCQSQTPRKPVLLFMRSNNILWGLRQTRPRKRKRYNIIVSICVTHFHRAKCVWRGLYREFKGRGTRDTGSTRVALLPPPGRLRSLKDS
jgi:hypothetical protein